VDATGETAIVTIYDNQQIVCIEKLETSQPVRMTLQVGSHRAPHAGASSKILMAYLPDSEIQAIIRDKGLPRLCANTITNPDEMMAELAAIRACGYARSLEETDRGAWGVATPVFDHNGRVAAAIGIAGPSSRCTDELAEHYTNLCRRAARRISSQLYGEPMSADA
jgi:DNA-binding IclR family transcriptional regulator